MVLISDDDQAFIANPPQSPFHDLQRQLRPVAFGRQMGQNHSGKTWVKQFNCEPSRCIVGKMPVTRGDAGPDGSGIGPLMEEPGIMVRFEDEEITSSQSVADLGRGPSKVGGYAQSDVRLRVGNGHGHWITGIVGGDERFHPQLAHGKRVACPIRQELLCSPEQGGTRLPCGLRDVDRRSMPTRKHSGTAGVVGMVMRDDNGVDLFGQQTQKTQSVLQGLSAETGVHE